MALGSRNPGRGSGKLQNLRQVFAIIARPPRGVGRVIALAVLAAALAAPAARLAAQTDAASRQQVAQETPPETGRLGHVTGRPLPRYESLRSGEVNLRHGPGGDHRVLWTITRRGLPVRIVAEYRDWRRVELHTGERGWIWRSLLSQRRTAILIGQTPELRRAPDTDAALAARVGPVTPLRLLGCAADWCRLERDGVAGWAPKSAIWGVDNMERF